MQLNNTPLFIGTSGYNHEDWKGSFAPAEIHSYDMLAYYADKGFNFLELAFTFYRLPDPDKINHILMRTGDRVRFSVRLPKTLIKNPKNNEIYDEFMRGMEPMLKKGLISAFYADYHPTFAAGKANQESIKALKDRFDVPFFAELHNRTWYKERVFEYLRENSIGLTVVDMPGVKGFAPYYPICTNRAIYYKLYGRSPHWLTSDKKHLEYDYSDEQMKKFLQDAVQVSVMAESVFFVFANVAGGLGPKNALRLAELAKE
jgi:uncharacterized protein YecE (DUF72 family)